MIQRITGSLAALSILVCLCTASISLNQFGRKAHKVFLWESMKGEEFFENAMALQAVH